MIAIIFSYILYNLIVGIVFAIMYYRTEGAIVDKNDFFYLLFLPIIGLGRWRYHQKIRLSEEVSFSKEWFVCKYMIKVHWGFIISLAFITIIGFIIFGGFLNSETKMSESDDSIISYGFGMLAQVGFILLFLLFLFIAAFVFAILFLILIFIPKFKMNVIESETYRQKYIELNRKNMQIGNDEHENNQLFN